MSEAAGKRSFSRRPRAERMEQIEAAARDVFSRNGFAAASISEIAAGAGVVEGTIYKYYENKRDLLLTVLQRWYESMIADYVDQLAGVAGLRNRLRFVIWRHLKSIKDNPDLCRLFYAEVRGSDDYYESTLYRLNREYTNVLMRILRDGMAAGELRPDLSIALVRDMIFGGIEHHVATFLARRGELDVERAAEQLTDMVMAGIVQPPPAPASLGLEAAVRRLERVAERLDPPARGEQQDTGPC
ncbi:transcriptional regulator, TetR family [Tistlia consotensis]|uniref:Transcriptional regulator, TetR family n=1 Tax=Tistlia consotensis USBA 355 TaxID=560819 RepID=A0A1Y6BCM9_9PROT|nr:TetR/AcrR family transcriptional regulator C-terminal domain-containing protein [Tistlia consotensis]SMF04554.1 transcriptional regulator, TetR family [Tistlia consotensis USBA 355]SNR54574.1 transcriptional regulator, TetR family [Tistlia consotensis]